MIISKIQHVTIETRTFYDVSGLQTTYVVFIDGKFIKEVKTLQEAFAITNQ